MKLPAACSLSIAALFATDALLFRTDPYRRVLEPDSYAGQVELMLHRAASSRADVLVLGDSRIGEGFSARVANSRGDARFFNASVPGSSPRCWAYLLPRLDPAKWRAIVVPLDSYEDEDGPWDFADNPLDTSILASTLTLSTAFEFANSHADLAAKATALRAGLFTGFAHQSDVQRLLAAPGLRLTRAEQHRAHAAEWSDGYQGRDASLGGMTVDWSARSVRFPDSTPPPVRDEIRAALFRSPSAQRGAHHRYRMRWLARIRDVAGPRMVVVPLPRGPAPCPVVPAGLPSAVRALRLRAAPEDLFRDLERPEFHADLLHLNRAGRTRFSERLAAYFANYLARRPALISPL